MTHSFEKLCKKEFPIINTCTYLNTASSGLISRKVFEFRNEYNQDVFQDYSKIDYLEDEQVETLKAKIKTYFNAKNSEIAVLPNFSVGINFIAEALPKASKIVMLHGDYPSLNLPFERRNFRIDYAIIDKNLEQNILQKVEQFKPNYLILSVVQFMTGILIDIDFLKKLKKNYPHLHIIGDATQYLGTTNFNFDNSPFSAIGTSGYKWLHAGTGNGFFMLKNDFLDHLEDKSVGSNSLLSKPNGPLRKVGFLEPGHFNMYSIKSLEVALDFHFKEVGIQHIESHLKSISTKAKKRFVEMNLLNENVVKRKTYSTIFNIKANENDLQKLLKEKIICAFRGNGIRISLQYFNNEEDLAKLEHIFKEKRA